MARIKDVIDDESHKLKPVSAVLLLLALGLSAVIAWNALTQQKPTLMVSALNAAAPGNSGVVVLKYDPLIQDAQRELLALGVYKGPIDGVNGLTTKQAITAYQQLNGLAQNGIATDELVNHMKFTHKVQAAAQFTGSVDQASVDPVLSTTAQATVIYEKAAADAVAASKAQELSVKRVQVVLAGLGYPIKRMDGHVNAETRAAILKYQMDNGMDMNGGVDKTLTAALNVE